MMYVVAMALAILASIMYHLVTRSIPAGVHPLVTLTITYLTAAALSVLLLPVFPLKGGLGEELRHVNWTSFALAVAILGIEAGFLLAYRAGWNISLADLVANASAMVILLPIGLIAFRERLTLAQVGGLVLCAAGLILINKK